MKRAEIITRLCEIAAELAELSQKADTSDVKFYLTDLEQHFQTTMQEMQNEEN